MLIPRQEKGVLLSSALVILSMKHVGGIKGIERYQNAADDCHKDRV